MKQGFAATVLAKTVQGGCFITTHLFRKLRHTVMALVSIGHDSYFGGNLESYGLT